MLGPPMVADCEARRIRVRGATVARQLTACCPDRAAGQVRCYCGAPISCRQACPLAGIAIHRRTGCGSGCRGCRVRRSSLQAVSASGC